MYIYGSVSSNHDNRKSRNRSPRQNVTRPARPSARPSVRWPPRPSARPPVRTSPRPAFSPDRPPVRPSARWILVSDVACRALVG